MCGEMSCQIVHIFIKSSLRESQVLTCSMYVKKSKRLSSLFKRILFNYYFSSGSAVGFLGKVLSLIGGILLYISHIAIYCLA